MVKTKFKKSASKAVEAKVQPKRPGRTPSAAAAPTKKDRKAPDAARGTVNGEANPKVPTVPVVGADPNLNAGTITTKAGMDLTEKVKELVRLAQEQGYLTYNDINDALPDTVVTPDDLDEIYIKLRNLEIEIVDPLKWIGSSSPKRKRRKMKRHASIFSMTPFACI